MAEIKITPKRPSLWPWVAAVATILVVVLVWAMMAGLDEDRAAGDVAVDLGVEDAETVEPRGDDPARAAATTGAVDDYVEFANEPGAAAEMGRTHEYTADGIRRLSGALESITRGQRNDVAQQRFEQFREKAERIQQDPASMQHAGTVRDVFTSAVEVIASLDGAPKTDRLRSTAESISPDQPLLEQSDAVRRFFRESAAAIETISNRSF